MMSSEMMSLEGEEVQQPRSLAYQYPGCRVASDPLSTLSFVRMASRYTGGETVNADPYCTVRLANGQEVIQHIYVWGVLCYRKTLTDKKTGEVRQAVGTVFRMGTETEPGDTYLSFTAESALMFVKRSLIPLMDVGLVSMGDWTLGLPIIIRKKFLEVGHTYNFTMPEEVTL